MACALLIELLLGDGVACHRLAVHHLGGLALREVRHGVLGLLLSWLLGRALFLDLGLSRHFLLVRIIKHLHQLLLRDLLILVHGRSHEIDLLLLILSYRLLLLPLRLALKDVVLLLLVTHRGCFNLLQLGVFS